MFSVGAHPIGDKLRPVTYVNAIVSDFGFVDSKAWDQVEEIDEDDSLIPVLERHEANSVRLQVVQLNDYVVLAILARQELQVDRLLVCIRLSCDKVFHV